MLTDKKEASVQGLLLKANIFTFYCTFAIIELQKWKVLYIIS